MMSGFITAIFSAQADAIQGIRVKKRIQTGWLNCVEVVLRTQCSGVSDDIKLFRTCKSM